MMNGNPTLSRMKEPTRVRIAEGVFGHVGKHRACHCHASNMGVSENKGP